MMAFWIILTGCLVAINCALLGNFLVLRRMSMVGDAISHAVLPGIVIAYLWSGTRDTSFMLIGASATGVIATLLIELIHRKAKLQTDAAIGVVFTFMFAIGVILITAFADQVDIDQDCVLYGEIAYVPIDMLITKSGVQIGPRPVYILSTTLLLVVTFLIIGFRNLKITSFDPEYAKSIGIPVHLWHYLLMTAVSITTVSSFETVGAILVVAFLIGPPSIAYLLTDDLKKMIIISIIIGIMSSFLGYYMAYWLNASIAGSMAVIIGVFFLITYCHVRLKSLYRLQEKSIGI